MPVRLILGLHNHQPVGNFDSVFAQAFADAYRPFLDLIAAFPKLPFVLHTSGCLLEWLEVHRKSYVKDLKALAARGQLEILGGAFYEPILPMLPRRDRLGQIRRYADHLHGLFGQRPRGVWLAERVWEPSLAADLADAGVEYTLLDDHHFRQAGLGAEELFHPFLTEDEGRLLKVFPISEPLRYLVPWKTAAEAVQYLVELEARQPDAVVVCADDGEKFGAWPSTHDWCFTKGWLKEFFERLCDEQTAGTLRVQTLAKTADETPTARLVYLPDCSYREMTEWALPPERQAELKRLATELEPLPEATRNAVRGALRGGLWRNFRAKYPELRDLYGRMLEVSERIEEARQEHRPEVKEAERELYQAQCNCAWWHGAFGGLYLPHLRHAIYSHLLAAETLLLPEPVRAGKLVEAEEADFNRDGQPELKLASGKLAVYLAPKQGGQLYELDLLPQRCNVQGSLARRPEAYHETIHQAAAGKKAASQVSLVEDGVKFKQEGLELLLAYDRWPRRSLLVHFWPEATTLEQVRSCTAEELGDFVEQVHSHELHREAGSVRVVMKRAGHVGPAPVRVTKQVTVRPGSDRLEISVKVEAKPGALKGKRLGVEFMVAGFAAGQADRYFSLPGQPKAGPLETVFDLATAERISLTDEYLNLRASLSWDRPGGLWAWPQQTVSQSEGGFEAVHQGNLLVPHWKLAGEETWETHFVWRFEGLG